MCFFLAAIPALAALAATAGTAAGAAGAITAGTAAAIAAGSTLIGGVASAAGAIQASQQQQAAAQANAQAQADAARRSLAATEQVKREHEIKEGQIFGAQKAAFAAGNVDVSSGSALDIMNDTLNTGQRTATNLLTNANNGVQSYAANARSYTMQAQGAQTSGMLNATTSLLGAANSVGDQWSKWQIRGTGFGGYGGNYGMGYS
jgi:hypothetical protein